jgi:hypothetical protein
VPLKFGIEGGQGATYLKIAPGRMLMGNFTGSVGVGRTVQNGGELMIAIAVLSLQGLPGGGIEGVGSGCG